jgi:hypothetical protein
MNIAVDMKEAAVIAEATANAEAAVTEKAPPLPYHAREIKTAAQLLSLKYESMLRDFEKETGATVWNLRRDHSDKITIDMQFEGSIIFTGH